MTRFWTLALAWLGGTTQQVLNPGTASNAAVDILRLAPIPATPSIVPLQQRPTIYGPNPSESDREPAVFAVSDPKHWGEESASIRLPGNATAILALNADETLLAVGYQSNVLLYQFPSLKHVQTLRGLGHVWKIEFLPGQKIFVYSTATTIKPNDCIGQYSISRLIDLEYELSRPFTDVDDLPSGIPRAVSAVLQSISISMEHEGVRVDTEDLRDDVAQFLTEIVKEDEMKKSLWFSKQKDGYESFVSPDGTFIVTTPEKHRRVILNSTTLEEKFRLSLVEQRYSRTQFFISPDSRFIGAFGAIGATEVQSGRLMTLPNQTITIWNASDGRQVYTLNPRIRSLSLPNVVISPDSSFMAASCEMEQSLCIWNLTSGELVHSMGGRRHWFHTFTFSPSSKYLAFPEYDRHGSSVRVLDMRTFDVQRHNLSLTSTASINHLSFHKEGRLICHISDGGIVAYDIATNFKWQFEPADAGENRLGRVGGGRDFALTKEGFINADYDGVIRVWNI